MAKKMEKSAPSSARILRLPNGMRVAMDRNDAIRSCAMGFWIEMGSKRESSEEAGLAHFIEHMLFKGTRRMGALDLADELNRLGGQVNAHTSQEAICLHARCVDAKAPVVLDLLAEMILESTFPEEEIRRERKVILEEYKMYEDNPDDVVPDLFFQTIWPRSPLGRPVIGRPETIRRYNAGQIRAFLAREFDPSRATLAISGRFEEAEILRILRRRFGALRPRRRRAQGPGDASNSGKFRLTARKIEQAHFCFGGLGPQRGAPDRYAFGLMNMVLGGGMSSRLFKEVREKRGLAYSIYSFAQPFEGAGCFGIHGSTSPSALPEVLEICLRELRRLSQEDIPDSELGLAKEQAVDALLMSVESAASRMTRMAESLLSLRRVITVDEAVAAIRAVTPRQARQAAERYLKGRALAGAFVGPKGIDASLARGARM